MRKKFLTREDVRKHTFRITSNAKRSGDSKIFLNWNQKHFGNEKKTITKKTAHNNVHRAKNSCITKLFPCFTISHFKDEIVNYAENENFCKKKNSNFFPCYNFENFIGEKSKFVQANHHFSVFKQNATDKRENKLF